MAAKRKPLPERCVIRTIAEAKRFLNRASFAPDVTVDPIDVIRDLLGLVEPRLTPDERKAVTVSLA